MKLKHPFLFLFLSFSFHSVSVSVFSPPPIPLIALLSIKSSLSDPLSTFKDWDTKNPDWCSWSGVRCNHRTNEITILDLSRRNISGTIPAEIRYLSTLVHLNLSSNSFDGNFPSSIFELPQIRILDISHNNFNSSFPPGISNLKFLRIFNAYSNSFTGELPMEFVHLRFLEELNLGGSYFGGRIPVEYGSIPSLRLIDLAGNELVGDLPYQLGFLTQLERMVINFNGISGGFPAEFSLLSNLKFLDISNCNLSGPLPPELGNLTNLETLYLFQNRITGKIPGSYTNLKSLKTLDLSYNQLSGEIPEAISSLTELSWLSLMVNNLSGPVPNGIAELPNLSTLLLWSNNFSGILPPKLGTNRQLLSIDVSSNSLTGPIPENLCAGNMLFKLIIFNNQFQNPLPRSLVHCRSLSRFRAQNNFLNGTIPIGFGLLPNLTFVDLSRNNFSGEIPPDLGDSPRLQHFNASENSLNGALPENLWRSRSLQIFSAGSNKLIGGIPDFKECGGIYRIELQDNTLNGSIPWDIDRCDKLLILNLSRNSLTGIIPWEISNLPSISDVDLSRNLLTGTIPSNFQNCSTIETFNVSYNLLTGRIPESGTVFSNLHPSSFSGNDGLCGGIVAKPCAADALVESRQQKTKKTAGAVVWILAAAIGVALILLVAGSRCFRSGSNSDREIGPWKLTAFQRLNFTAEDVMECLTETDKILGMGSTGTVHKAEMPGGEIIAVKKLWGKHKENITRRRGVLAEVDVLGNVRHRNIVRLLGCCSNSESTMLLYEFMPNGNLDDLLHSKSKGGDLAADWVTRYKIALGVAQGICYLHHDCDPVIVHRDLKPSNILLDADLEARVADFGVAKLILSHESMSVIAGSYGYIAPEYAYTLQVDEKSDIYSYGVVLLEIITGKRSVESEFGEGNSIVDWVRSKIKSKNGVIEVLDKNAGASCAAVREEMMQMLKIALLCTSRNPADRPSMREVVFMLQEAKPKRKFPEISVISCGGGGGNVIGGGGDSGEDSGEAEKGTLECSEDFDFILNLENGGNGIQV